MDYKIIGRFVCDYNMKDMIVFRDETGAAHVVTVDEFVRLRDLKPIEQFKKNIA